MLVAIAHGSPPAVLVGGVATTVFAGLWAWLFPSLRLLDRFPGHPAHVAAEVATTDGVPATADAAPYGRTGSSVPPG